MRKIILASASKRRHEILLSCGIRHTVKPSGKKEISCKNVSIMEMVRKNAEIKAESVAARSKNAVVIGADTLVVHGSTIIGKPKDAKEAKGFLFKFSGSDIEVYTGLSVIDSSNGKKASAVEMSELKVARIDKKDIERYFDLLGPYDKAGGFSIEGVGSIIFDDIRGSYFNILGLPMMTLSGLFSEIGLDLLDFIDKGHPAIRT